jgi:hypothetical protein
VPKGRVKAQINQPLGGASATVVSGGGAGDGVGTFPDTVSLATQNTVVGSKHTHRVDLSAHVANAAAHHAPVTVGNTGLALSTQELSLNLAAVSGLEVASGLKLADSIAGAGLTIASKVLAVGVSGLGLSVGADAVVLTSSANPGAAASILATDASGYLALVKLTTPLLDTASGNMTVAPAGDLVLDPVGNDVLPGTGYDLNLGSLAKKYLTLHAAELWVETLVAQDTIATIGGRILVGPTTTLTADVAAEAGIFSLKHNEANSGDVLYMEAGGQVEFVQIVVWTIVDGGRAGPNYFVIDGNYASLFTAGTKFTVRGATGNNGEYTVTSSSYDGSAYTVIYVTETPPSATWDGHILYRGSGPYLYNVLRDRDGSGANAWYAGDALFNTGNVGDGFIDLYSVHGVKSATQYGPTIVGNVRTSTTHNAWAEHWALGNLNGVYGYGATAYGFAAGKYADGAAFVTVDATNGIRMLSRAGGADTVRAQWAVDGTLTIGEVAAGKSNVQVSAGALAIRLNTTNLIAADTAGNLALGQVATNQGNAYWNATNKRLEFRGGTNGTVVQAYVDTDGSVVAGSGAVVMDADGLSIMGPSGSWDEIRALKIKTADGVVTTTLGAIGISSDSYRTYLWARGVEAIDRNAAQLYLQVSDYGVDRINASPRIVLNSPAYNGTAEILLEATRVAVGGRLDAMGDVVVSGALRGSGNYTFLRFRSLNIANNGTAQLADAAVVNGLVFVVNASEGYAGTFVCRGGYVTVLEAFDPSNVFSTTKDTASSINVYWSGTRYEVQNTRGATCDLSIMLFKTE